MVIPSVSFSSPWLGGQHALQLHSGFCCEPPRSSHGPVGNVQKSPIAIYLKGSDASLEFCCLDPALRGIREGA